MILKCKILLNKLNSERTITYIGHARVAIRFTFAKTSVAPVIELSG